MTKKIDFGTKPVRLWEKEEGAGEAKGPSKRLTLDIDQELHRRVRVACATQGLVMADVIRELLERRFPAQKATAGQ